MAIAFALTIGLAVGLILGVKGARQNDGVIENVPSPAAAISAVPNDTASGSAYDAPLRSPVGEFNERSGR
jgi:hypothetical protein